MSRRLFAFILAAAALGASGRITAGNAYVLDPAHSAVTFKISHAGLSWTHGRFNDVSGGCSIDAANPAQSRFSLTMKAASIDTGNAKRDEHLRSPDFFNVKQYPTISFASTSVKPVKDGFEVTGMMTMHGVAKPITFTVLGGRKAEFPKGVQRTGYTAEFVLKRSEFGIDKFGDMLGDEVHTSVSFEATKK